MVVRNARLEENSQDNSSEVLEKPGIGMDRVKKPFWFECTLVSLVLEEPFQLDVQGFELHKFPTSMSYQDFFLEERSFALLWW